MILKVSAESMPAFAVSDKIKISRFCGMRRSLKRSFTWHRDWRRWQTGYHVGIVRRWRLKIFLADIAGVAITHPINDRWIGLQTHTNSQPVNENGSHFCTFAFNRGFFFDD